MNIETFITALRESDSYMETIFMHGSCYKFAKMLEKLFPSGEIWMELHDHAVYHYNGHFWDITGKVTGLKLHKPNKEEIEMMEKWGFAENNYLSLGDCDGCGEPLILKTKQEQDG